MERPLKVKEITSYIDALLKRDPLLKNVYVEGEVSNFKVSGGHVYFSLKEETATIRCVIFKTMPIAKELKLKDGAQVIVRGSITTYQYGSNYQILVKEVEEVGKGDIFREYEKLKQKLLGEGIFDADKKLPLPVFPGKIGVVTAETGAAIRDIINTIKRRFPIADIIFYPAKVQGEGAAQELIRGLDYLESRDDIDVIIIGRGGGSFEDLNAFNDEALVRRVFSTKIPTVSAVGHEVDNMLTDFSADKRAATPTGAAEIVTPDLGKIFEQFDAMEIYLEKKIASIFQVEYRQLEYLEGQIRFLNPLEKIGQLSKDLDVILERLSKGYKDILVKKIEENNSFLDKLERYNPKAKIQCLYMDLDNILENLNTVYKHCFIRKKIELDYIGDKLYLINPTTLLKKGYARINVKNKIVKSVEDMDIGDVLNIVLADGKVTAVAKDKEKYNG